MQLSSVAESRHNNFNLMRMVAAWLVVLSHAYNLLHTGIDPISIVIGWIVPGSGAGELAVNVFFVTSGFLVTKSALSSSSTLQFLKKRLLRIYPALIAMVTITVATCAFWLSSRTIGEFFSAKETWLYVCRNSVLLFNSYNPLPGVFERNPFPNVVNGSLWTLPHEVRLYLLLGGFTALAGFARISRRRILQLGLGCTAALAISLYVAGPEMTPPKHMFMRLCFLYCAGGLCYLFAQRIRLNVSAFFLTVLSVSTLSIFSPGPIVTVAGLCALVYGVFCVAYVPSGPLLRYNKLGDYSYGVYISSFPIQQTLIQKLPRMTPVQLAAASTIASLIFAVISWHWVEKRFLHKKTPQPTIERRTAEQAILRSSMT